MKYILVLFLMAFLAFSCKKSQEVVDIEQIKRECFILKPGYSSVKLTIDNKNFYENSIPFKTYFDLSENHLKTGLLDSINDNVMLDIQKTNWLKGGNLEFFKLGSDDYSRPENIQLMIGRLIESDGNLSAEGYIFENGKVKFELFTKDLVILSIKGFVMKPGIANIKENFIPIEGYIAMKNIPFKSEGKPLNTFFK